MAEMVHRRNEDKQIGCMSIFLHIFDRQQILARKRIHSAKRLPPTVGASSETVSSVESPEFSQELEKTEPEAEKSVVALVGPASARDSQSFSAKSENGRRISSPLVPTRIDGDDNQWRPPSVIARLMGLESLTLSDQKTQQNVRKIPAIPRSVSERRVSRDLVHSKYIDNKNFQLKQPNQSHNRSIERIVRDEASNLKSDFHPGDFFPEENQTTATMHVDSDKKLKMSGMNEQFNDLTALKQILEVLQHKGLLHSTNRSNADSHRNFDRNLHYNESSIHLKQWRSLASKVDKHRSVNGRVKRDGGAVHRSSNVPAKPKTSSPNRIESNLKSCNSIIKRKPLSIEIERSSPKKTGSVHHSVINRSPRNRKLTDSSSVNCPKQTFIKNAVEDDESSSISESIISAYSITDSERSGWRLLERCSNLLHSIAEMNSTTESPPSSAAVLPSPVSVLDSGFDKDESSSPSHSIDFKASPTVDFDDDNWSPKISPTKSTEHEEFISDDSDFIYISEILRTPPYLGDDSTVFFSVGKQLYDSENTSNVSKQHRKLVFDVISETLDRNRQLPPWKSSIGHPRTSLKQIWYEFQKIREMIINTGDDLLELITGVLKKELVEIKDWQDYPIETSETILDVERLIFKELVTEAIEDLVTFSGKRRFSRTRRKLVF